MAEGLVMVWLAKIWHLIRALIFNYRHKKYKEWLRENKPNEQYEAIIKIEAKELQESIEKALNDKTYMPDIFVEFKNGMLIDWERLIIDNCMDNGWQIPDILLDRVEITTITYEDRSEHTSTWIKSYNGL